jgi:hypothetical protein
LQADIYFFLLKECNERGWENPFEISNRLICANLGITEPSLVDARKRLQRAGLIEFQNGKRNAQSPVYELISDKSNLKYLSRNRGESLDTSLDKPLDENKSNLKYLSRNRGESLDESLGESITYNNKTKIKTKNKESANADKKGETNVSTSALPILESDPYKKFKEWMSQKAPYCADTKNFPHQITEEELIKLKETYTSTEIASIVEQIENRKDLRKRYTNLYRTVLNWAKKEYGK